MNSFFTLGSLFDDAIFNVLGSSLDDFFSSPSNYSYSKKSVTQDGHTAEIVGRPDKSGNVVSYRYLDGKRVDSLPEKFERALAAAPAHYSTSRLFEPFGCNNKLPKPLVTGTDIPHTDVLLGKDGSMTLRFSLAGVSEDRIGISAEDDFLLIEVQKADVPESDKNGLVYLQKGIKSLDGYLHKKVFIDPKKYSLNSLIYEYNDGLLTVSIPAIKVKKEDRKVFKKIR